MNELPLPDYIRHKILHAGLLFFVCASRRPSLLSTVVEVYEGLCTVTDEGKIETATLLSTHLRLLFDDVRK